MGDIVETVFRLSILSNHLVLDNWGVVVTVAAGARRVAVLVNVGRSLFNLVQQLDLVISLNWGVVVAMAASARRVSMLVNVR